MNLYFRVDYITKQKVSSLREESYSFLGATAPQKAILWEQTVHGHDINVVFGTDFGVSKNENSLIIRKYSSEIMTSLSSLPKSLATKIDKIIVSTHEAPDELKSSPDEIYSSMTIGDKITIFPSGISDSITSTVFHEAAHAFKNSLPNNGKDFLEQWKVAIKKYKIFLNKYSHQSTSEDFSESTVAYFISKDTPC